VTRGGLFTAILSDKPDDVLADLKRQLEQRIADARRVISQSQHELVLVEQAIFVRTGIEPSRASDSAPAVANDDAADRDRQADGRFQGIPRARILTVASTVPYPITPPRVVEAFAERGESVNLEQIRIALNRIAKDGNLTKVGPSLFAVPGNQAAETETADEAGRRPAESPAPRTPVSRPAEGPAPRTPVSRPADTDAAHVGAGEPKDTPHGPFRRRGLEPVSRDAFRRTV